MVKRRRIWIALATAGACFVGLWQLGSESDEREATRAERFVNQLWIERMPADSRDMFGRLVALRTDDGRVGIVGRGSTWRHFTEVFLWALEEDRLTVVFPQERKRGKVHVETWKCEGDAPEPFELCLEIRAGDRRARYFSRREWKIRPKHPHADLEAIATEHPELRSVATQWDEPAVAAAPDEGSLREADVAAAFFARPGE